MKFLKGLALSFLGFLLVLSLSIFGSAFMINQTVLNPDFVVSEIDKLDVASLVDEITGEGLTQDGLAGEFRDALANTVTKFEPLVKEQVGNIIYPVYDYLLGRSQNLDLALILGDTILSPDFVASLLDELDMSSLIEGILIEQAGQEGLPEEFRVALTDAITDAKPLIKEQVGAAVGPLSDYLLGKSQRLNVVISLGPMVESLKDSLWEVFLESLPPELEGLPLAQLEPFFDAYFQELSGAIPSTFVIDESMLGAEIPAQMAEALATAEGRLAEARLYVGYFQLWFKVLIGFIVLLILGIVFLHRQVRGATRSIGVTFLVYAVPWYVGFFLFKSFATPQVVQIDMPASLQVWLLQLVDDFLAPLGTLCLGLLIAGVVLVIVSFVYKPRQSEF